VPLPLAVLAGLPRSVVMKSPSARLKTRVLAKLVGIYQNECGFYEHLAGEVIAERKGMCPTGYHATYQNWGCNFL
jgi:hypothetical protein